MPSPSRADVAITGHAVETVEREQPLDVLDHPLATLTWHLVDVVEDHDHDVLVRGHRLEEVLVHRLVGVLLRVQHPDHQVRQHDQPLHLEVVAELGRVVVGEVEQDQALEVTRVTTGVEHGVARGLVPQRDAHPLEQVLGTLRAAPDAGAGPRRRRASYADRGQVETGQRVERRGLAGAGGPGDRDHGVLRGEPQPGAGPLHDRRRRVDHLVVQPPAARLDRLVEPGDLVGQVGLASQQPACALQQRAHPSPSLIAPR
jgi:hypothetical protein